jgi:hypothetical protein
MSYSIIWSPRALNTFVQVTEYLGKKWTGKEVEKFIERTDEVLAHIKNNPLQYIYSKELNAHRSVITKQVSLLYQIEGESIELLVFWDTRQDPQKL